MGWKLNRDGGTGVRGEGLRRDEELPETSGDLVRPRVALPLGNGDLLRPCEVRPPWAGLARRALEAVLASGVLVVPGLERVLGARLDNGRPRGILKIIRTKMRSVLIRQ